jgi:hypothetical protein
MADAVRVEGLAEFRRGLKGISKEAPKGLRLALNEAADLVVSTALPKIPRRTGRAAASLKAASTQTASRVRAGSGRAPYYPWLDFGGRTGKNKSVARPFYKDGRYIYKAYFDLKSSGQFQAALEKAIVDVARRAGLEVD